MSYEYRANHTFHIIDQLYVSPKVWLKGIKIKFIAYLIIPYIQLRRCGMIAYETTTSSYQI